MTPGRPQFSNDFGKAMGVVAFLAGSAALTLNTPAHAHWLLPAIERLVHKPVDPEAHAQLLAAQHALPPEAR